MFEPVKRTEFLRYWAVPLFLLVVALLHMYRVHAYNQSSWGAGCGFGMFATVDYHDTRFFRCQIKSTEHKQYTAFFRPELNRLDLQARVVPSKDNMATLANSLSMQNWFAIDIFKVGHKVPLETVACTSEAVKKYVKTKYGDSDIHFVSRPIEIKSFDVSVFGTRLDLTNQRLQSHLLATASLTRN